MTLSTIKFFPLLLSSPDKHSDADASAQGEADVFLRSLSEFCRVEGPLSWREIQQEQHRSAHQVVQQLSVSFLYGTIVVPLVCIYNLSV